MVSDSASGDRLVDALVQLSFEVTAVLTRIGSAHDLSLTQLRVLGIIRGRRPRMSDLADYMGLERSTMSGLVARAEVRGLVVRAPSADDARAIEVMLTPAGVRLGEQIHAEAVAALNPLTAGLTQRERAQLQRLLERALSGGRA